MNEISQILEANEKIIWDGKPKYSAYMFSAILGCLLVALFLILFLGVITGAILGVLAFAILFSLANLSYKFIHYALTDKRAVLQSGIFGRSFKSVKYDEIKNASVSKGFFNWIFGTGNINIFTGEVTSTGGKNPRTVSKYDTFAYISDPYAVLKELQEHGTEMEENLYGGKNVVQRVQLVK